MSICKLYMKMRWIYFGINTRKQLLSLDQKLTLISISLLNSKDLIVNTVFRKSLNCYSRITWVEALKILGHIRIGLNT